ncbi:MAG: hypothetical protein ABIA11_01875 [Patescibacteria group bacterium]
MRKLIHLILTSVLIGFALLSIQCQKKSVEQLQIEGDYQIDTEYIAGELNIKRLSVNKISFSVATVTKHPGQHTAAIDGEATISGNVASFQNTEDASCKLTIIFTPNQAVIKGADSNCRTYMGAAAVLDGIYKKMK